MLRINNYLVGIVKNGLDLLGDGLLKSALSHALSHGVTDWADFLHTDTNSGKLKGAFIVIWWAWSSMGVAF